MKRMKALWKAPLLALLLAVMLTAGAMAEADAQHVLLSDMDEGSCMRLTDAVQLTVVLVDLPDAPWDQPGRAALTEKVEAAGAWLEQEADAYGAQLDVSARYYDVQTVAAVVQICDDSHAWAQTVLKSAPELLADEALRCGPVLFCLNTDGRAFASKDPADGSVEYCVLYINGTAESICHEVMHLYGAWDYYYHAALREAAQRCCPGSIMLETDGEVCVDSLTAYVIGWTDELDETAQALLMDTAALTEDDVLAALANESRNGYVTKTTETGVYTGLLEGGQYHGWGRYEWADGSVYEGEWVQGARSGFGTMHWPNGVVYEGEWVQGARSGFGTMHWPNGASYTGDSCDGRFHGWGRYEWADGIVYEGEWVQDARSGFGTMRWPNGASYTGDFCDGQFHGWGCYEWPEGSVYEGEWVQGARSGSGTMRWENGMVYIGDFVRDVKHGQGKQIMPDGSVYIGGFLNNAEHGYGTLTQPDGNRWEGRWINGRFVQ